LTQRESKISEQHFCSKQHQTSNVWEPICSTEKNPYPTRWVEDRFQEGVGGLSVSEVAHKRGTAFGREALAEFAETGKTGEDIVGEEYALKEKKENWPKGLGREVYLGGRGTSRKTKRHWGLLFLR